MKSQEGKALFSGRKLDNLSSACGRKGKIVLTFSGGFFAIIDDDQKGITMLPLHEICVCSDVCLQLNFAEPVVS